jgi:protein SCO1/2
MTRKLILLGWTLARALVVQAQAPDDFRGALITPPQPKPRFVLADTSGRPFDFGAETKDHVTLLFFGYTYCPNQCPMHMSVLSAALKRLPPKTAEQVKLVFVTTDPERDSPAVLRRWLDLFDGHFIGLTGTLAAIVEVQRLAGVPVAVKTGATNRSYGVNHANFVLAYSKDNLAHVIYPGGVSRDDWVHDLPRLVNATWKQ